MLKNQSTDIDGQYCFSTSKVFWNLVAFRLSDFKVSFQISSLAAGHAAERMW